MKVINCKCAQRNVYASIIMIDFYNTIEAAAVVVV